MSLFSPFRGPLLIGTWMIATCAAGVLIPMHRSAAEEAKANEPGAKSPGPKKAKPGAALRRSTDPDALRVYRRTDPPPQLDEARLRQLGIQRHASKRLQLFTDLPSEKAGGLPGLMDQIYSAWVEYFGPLPADRDKTDFMMTGYLMVDPRPFREARLLSENLPPFAHGRNRGAQFWLNDQPTDYYRRHLLLHEGTHCYMTAVDHPLKNRAWYMEGMAELFATHAIDDKGNARFRILPHDREQFANLGRIRLVEDEVRESGPRTLSSILEMVPDDFLSNPPYAWAWAVCQFFDGHPRYHEPFRRFGRSVTTGLPDDGWEDLFSGKFPELDEEWLLFAANLCHGYDQKRAAIDFRDGRRLGVGESASAVVRADRGWQSSGLLLNKGDSLSIHATGRFVIARTTVDGEKKDDIPWESEPQGISIRYHAGEPLGKLVAVIRSAEPPKGAHSTMLDVIPIGRAAEIVAEVTGTLYFRLNDAWNELAENSGEVQVKLRRER